MFSFTFCLKGFLPAQSIIYFSRKYSSRLALAASRAGVLLGDSHEEVHTLGPPWPLCDSWLVTRLVFVVGFSPLLGYLGCAASPEPGILVAGLVLVGKE